MDQFWLNTGLFYSSSQFCLRRSLCFEKGEKKSTLDFGNVIICLFELDEEHISRPQLPSYRPSRLEVTTADA